jgi:hypothetical protein
METFGNQNQQKLVNYFYCELCDYESSRKYNFDTHLNSLKHRKNTENSIFGNQTKQNQQTTISDQIMCKNCDKLFINRSGLWKHKKKCLTKDELISLIPSNIEEQKELMQFLIKENSDFKQLMIDQNKTMIELAKNSGHNINNNTTTHNNNNFNLNFYLNETCKNAMNITDFISQLSVNLTNLEDTGRLGFAEGISKIFIDGLKQINVTDRPLHCSDFKREILYIKNNNEWNKETDNKSILTNAIKHLANKNIKQIFEWTKKYPDYNDYRSRKNDKYLQIVSQSMSGSTEEESNKNYSKIIKNIVRETVIHK